MRKIAYTALAILLTAASCAPKVQQGSEPISQYASDIINGKDSPVRDAIAATAKPDSKGSICLIGEMTQTETLRDFLASADLFDNTCAAAVPDGIPDFAGEQFISVLDIQASPYSAFFADGQLDSLGRLTFRRCLSAIDSTCCISPYDKVGIGRKDPAKLIILNSAYLCAFAESDVASAFEQIGSSVEIVSTLGCMLSELMESRKDSYRIAVLAPEEVADPEVYLRAFRRCCTQDGIAPSECFVFHADSCRNPLAAMLDAYVAQGKVSPLDAVLVDDNIIDLEEIAAMVEKAGSVMNEEYMIYSPLLGKDFKIISAQKTVARKIFSILRENKLFRLKIARPQVSTYMTLDDRLIPYSDRYIK